MNPDDGPTLIAFDGSAAARQAVAAAAALLKPRTTLVLTVWEAALAHAAMAPPPDVAMTPAVDPSATLTFDEALRGHAERVSNDGAELARLWGWMPNRSPWPTFATSLGRSRRWLVNTGQQRSSSVLAA